MSARSGVQFLALAAALLVAAAQAQDTIWTRRFDSGYDEQGVGAASCESRLAMVGMRSDSTGLTSDWLVVMYNQQGETLWTRSLDWGQTDAAIDACFDRDGNVLVVGYSMPYSAGLVRRRAWWDVAPLLRDRDDTPLACVAKFDSSGGLKWQQSRPLGLAFGVATDSAGNCYVSGAHVDTSADFWWAKYGPNGDTVWSRTLDRTYLDFGYRLTATPDGNFIFTGYSGDTDYVCALIKFNPDGDTLWTRMFRFGDHDMAIGIAADQYGNVAIAGSTGSDTTDCTLVFKCDSTGDSIWASMRDFASYDMVTGVAFDSAGNVFAAGASGDYPDDYVTLKYSPDGETLWTAFYDNGADDMGNDVVCDPDGNPVVIGGSQSAQATYDFVTIKYEGVAGIAEPQPGHGTRAVRAATLRAGNALRFDVLQPGPYCLELYDAAGRGLGTVCAGPLSPGRHEFLLCPVTTGVCFLRVVGPDRHVAVEKLVRLE